MPLFHASSEFCTRIRVDIDCTEDWYKRSVADSCAAFNEAVNERADNLFESEHAAARLRKVQVAYPTPMMKS